MIPAHIQIFGRMCELISIFFSITHIDDKTKQVSSDIVHMDTLLSWSRKKKYFFFIKPYVEVWYKNYSSVT